MLCKSIHDKAKQAAVLCILTAAWSAPVGRFHVIVSGTQTTQGNIPQAWIDAQVRVLNAAYAGRFTFTWLGTTRTLNTAWYPLGRDGITPGPEFAMKSALRRGTTPATLNFYTSQLKDRLLGWATLPRASTRTDRK